MQNFKYSQKVNTEFRSADGRGIIDTTIQDFFKSNRGQLSNKLIFRGEESAQENTPIQMSLSLTAESIAQDLIAGNYKLTVDLIFQILVVDFKSKEIMATFPIRIEKIDTKAAADGAYTDPEITTVLKKIYDGTEPVMHDLLRERLKDVRLSSRLGQNVRIYNVKFAERCKKDLPGGFLQGGRIPDAYKNLTAQKLSLFTQAELGVAVLPYAKDSANSSMALNFADQSVVQFKIPDATYGIDLEVQGFKKVHDKAKSSTARQWWLYGAFVRMKVYDPDFGDVYYTKDTQPTKGTELAGTWITNTRKADEVALFNVGLEKIILTGLVQMRTDKAAAEFISKSRN